MKRLRADEANEEHFTYIVLSLRQNQVQVRQQLLLFEFTRRVTEV